MCVLNVHNCSNWETEMLWVAQTAWSPDECIPNKCKHVTASKTLLYLYDDTLCVVATNRTHLTCRREVEKGNTHIDHRSGEASPAQDKVRHVGGAAWNPEGHVSNWRRCRTREGTVTGCSGRFSDFHFFFFNLSEHKTPRGTTLQRDCCILVASTCLHVP